MNLLIFIIYALISLFIVLDISKIKFVLMYIKGNRGSGKTLFTTNYAIDYSRKYPNNKIYANYKLNLKNAIYNPFMLLNYSELDNCLLIIDDIKGIKNFDYFTTLIANWSRKSFFQILLTGQYIRYFKKSTREMAEYEVQCKYIKKKDKLLIAFINPNNKVHYQQIKNAVKNAKPIYDTFEKIPIATNYNLIQIIKENSKCINDIEVNLSLYFNQRKITSLIPKIARELGFIK